MRVWGEKIDARTLRVYARHAEALEAVPVGQRLRITVDRDRNGKFNALAHLVFARLVKAINAGPGETDIRRLKQFIKLKRGWYDVVELPRPVNGVTHAIDYRSTSYASMGEEEFRRYVLDACDIIRAELAPWIGRSDEWPEILQLVNSIAPENSDAGA